MADSIKLSIISGFDATGANQAKAAAASLEVANQRRRKSEEDLNDAAGKSLKTMKAGAAGAAALAGALGTGSGGVAAAARMASGGMAAFAAGGAWAAAIAVIVSGIAMLVDRFQRAKAAASEFAKESRKAFDARLLDIQKQRLDGIVSGHKALVDALNAEAKARNDINAAAEKTMAAEFRNQALNLKGGMATALEGVSDPGERKRIELEYAEQIAAVEREAAKVAAQSAENAARRKLEIARRELESARDYVKTLEGEQGRSKLSEDILKELESADTQVAAAGGEVDAAQEELTAALLNLKNVTTENAISQTLSAQAQLALQKQLEERERNARALAAAEEQIAATEAALQTALKEEISARTAAAAALRKEAYRDRSVAGGSGRFVSDRIAKREAAKEEADQLEEDQRRAANLRRKQKAGTKLSRRDAEFLDIFGDFEQLRNAGRVGVKAFDAEKNAQRQVDLLQQHLGELQGIRADLQAAVTLN